MSKKFTLQPLLDLAQDKLDDAAKALQTAKAEWQQAEQQLAQLQQFKLEYQQRLLESQRHGMSIGAVRDFQRFLHKLDTAIEQQYKYITHCQRQWEARQQDWMNARKELKAYDTLATRHQRQEEQRQAKRDQKILDEFAIKRFWANRHANS